MLLKEILNSKSCYKNAKKAALSLTNLNKSRKINSKSIKIKLHLDTCYKCIAKKTFVIINYVFEYRIVFFLLVSIKTI